VEPSFSVEVVLLSNVPITIYKYIIAYLPNCKYCCWVSFKFAVIRWYSASSVHNDT
jgi:hypothetical protein